LYREKDKYLTPGTRYSIKKLNKNEEIYQDSQEKITKSRKFSVNLPPIPSGLGQMELDFSVVVKRSSTIYQSGKTIAKGIKKPLIIKDLIL